MRKSAACEVSNVKRELRHALAPVEQVAPVAADLREEDAARPHAQDRRDVLDQRRDAPREAGVGVVAQELLDRVLVDRAGARGTPSGDSGTNRWMVSTGEPISAANAALRSMPARASSSSRSTRTNAPLGQRDGRLGGHGRVAEPVPSTRIACADRGVVATCFAGEAELEPAPGPPSRRSAICSGSGAALSSGMARSQST